MENQNMRINREQMIAKVINTRYSVDDQIAILRQRDAKPEEYQAFFDFAEQVKKDVSAEYAANGRHSPRPPLWGGPREPPDVGL